MFKFSLYFTFYYPKKIRILKSYLSDKIFSTFSKTCSTIQDGSEKEGGWGNDSDMFTAKVLLEDSEAQRVGTTD